MDNYFNSEYKKTLIQKLNESDNQRATELVKASDTLMYYKGTTYGGGIERTIFNCKISLHESDYQQLNGSFSNEKTTIESAIKDLISKYQYYINIFEWEAK